jgi:hypothetical protein
VYVYIRYTFARDIPAKLRTLVNHQNLFPRLFCFIREHRAKKT